MPHEAAYLKCDILSVGATLPLTYNLVVVSVLIFQGKSDKESAQGFYVQLPWVGFDPTACLQSRQRHCYIALVL